MALAVALSAAKQGGQAASAPVINVGFDLTLDASYPTGGYPFDAAAMLQSKAKYDKAPLVVSVVPEMAVSGHTAAYDYTAKKVKIFVAAGTEVPNATDLSVTPGTLKVLVIAK